ncbi:DUF2164 domain-containing protein [Candidatus Woesebacteria bacterium]|nr:DUF2164 domain-containing protein [Candidatus Woesebacteria bacterium]MCD8507732.1 DUF2164 domain-containing protein [Candidatus Woesebacteria bacterium]MCD8527212.1 DUF2164 domain-containing protein [Candidatus Woesebacteria bacterium]MCD8546577.1 DUF2164 domain-containing protein [Candidatus Woesebacteria bacterium]
MKRAIDTLLTAEQRQAAIERIIDFFATERDEEIGIIAAGEVLDMFLHTVGQTVYNKGVEDSSEWMQGRFTEVIMDLLVNLKKE